MLEEQGYYFSCGFKTFSHHCRKSRSSKLHESEDDGDYARLRELPMLSVGATEQSDGDTASEDNKVIIYQIFCFDIYFVLTCFNCGVVFCSG